MKPVVLISSNSLHQRVCKERWGSRKPLEKSRQIIRI